MVVSVHEMHQRRRSSHRDGKVSHTRAFVVTTSDITDGTAVAIDATDGITSIPGPGYFYAGVPFSGKDAEPVQDSGNHFEVTVEYSDNASGTQSDVHPLDRPPEVSWSNTEGTEPYFIDESAPAKPVVNSAGDAFEQFLERETAGQIVITVTRNEDFHDAALADEYSHTVNTDAITIDGTIFPPGTLKLSPIQASKHVEKVRLSGVEEFVTYYRKTYTFKARRDGWKDHPLDVGTSELIEQTESINGINTIVKKLIPIVDAAGLPVKHPWPLNGSGRRKLNPTDTPNALEFKPYKEKAFAPLLV